MLAVSGSGVRYACVHIAGGVCVLEDNMVTPTEVVRHGLEQLPSDGLARIAAHIADNKPICLTGELYWQGAG